MSVTLAELSLATSIEALDAIAKEKSKMTLNGKEFERICRDLRTLFKHSQVNYRDQEKAYVYHYRFQLTHEEYSRIINDDKFLEKLFHKELMKSKKQLDQLRKELVQRYSEKQTNERETRKSLKKTTVISTSSNKFPDDHISCEELSRALAIPNNILVVDARPEKDFKESRINMRTGTVINIPDHIIKAGLSAHCIGEALPNEYKAIWNKRDTFDVLVLLDWNSTFENMTSTKLEKLLDSLVQWDIRKTYAQKPVILDGGYLEWGEKYPSFCSNPNIVMNKINKELDELLNLDDIQYLPVENQVPIITFQETKMEIEEEPEGTETREELIRRNKELSMQTETVLNELIAQENKWKDWQKVKPDQLKDLETHIADLEKQLEQLTDQKNETQEKFELYAGFDPQKENFEANQIKEMVDIDKLENQKILILQTVAKQRLDELAKARALKPKAAGDPTVAVTPSPSVDTGLAFPGSKANRPLVNRSNKPSMPRAGIFEGSIVFNPEGGGLIGLKNIRNTCYMNTVVQCMRNVPKLAELFCTGLYSKHIQRKSDAIIIDTAFLFRLLWSNIHKCVTPSNFYEKVCAIEPNYRMGNHEDCMEFFLFLLNNLSEDCAYDVQKPDTMSPAQQAWFNQLGGRGSIFTELFYHQLRITQICRNCNKTTYKFEMESTFMLPVPEHDFKIEDLMRNYLQDYVIDDYCCSKCKQPVTNSKTICRSPKILVIVLKRYKQVIRNNNVSVSKIDSRVFFPTTSFVFGGMMYNLNAIAMHSGSMTSGHYTAACLANSRWYEFNDEVVRPLNIDDDLVRSKACAFFYSIV